MHFVHTICVVCLFHIFNSFPSPATGQDRDALKRCGPKFGFFFQCDDTGKYLVIGIQDMFFGIWGAFIRGDAGRVFCLFLGPAAGRDWDRGEGAHSAGLRYNSSGSSRSRGDAPRPPSSVQEVGPVLVDEDECQG